MNTPQTSPWKPYSELPKEKGHNLKSVLVAYNEGGVIVVFWNEIVNTWVAEDGAELDCQPPDWYMEIPARPQIKKAWTILYKEGSGYYCCTNPCLTKEMAETAFLHLQKEGRNPIIIPLEWTE